MENPVRPGDLVSGKYRVERVLGEGAMGIVVLALHEQLEQRVALKFLHPHTLAMPEVVQRFVREARAAVKIHSEHVARVLDVGALESGTPYMVMEYLEGEDLARVLAERGALPVEEAVGYVLEVCEVVAEAHSIGIVHRDLKPANLFLARRPGGRAMVKVLDFGISKLSSSAKDAVVTASFTMMGSPGYMSPEQMTAAATTDSRSDVWSLGVVLYELLACRLPFSGDSIPELFAAILTHPPAPIASLRADVPPELQAVVDRCLQKQREQRFANVAELARAIAPFGPVRGGQSVERIEHVLGFSSEPPPPVPVPAIATPPSPTASTPPPRVDGLTFVPTTRSSSPMRRSLLVIPAAAAVLGGALAIVMVGARVHRRAVPSPPPPAAKSAVLAFVPPLLPPPAETLAEPAPAETRVATSSDSPPGTHRPPAPPAWASAKPGPGATPSIHPQPSASTAASGPPCRIVSYFDTGGNKHFKRECP